MGRLVVVLGLARRLRAGKEAAVEDSGRDHADASLHAEGEEIVQAVLLEERVPAGEHHDVHVGRAHEPRKKRRVVHAGADRCDCALGSELCERGKAGGDHVLEVVVGIVEIGDVDPVEAQALEALR